MVQYGIYDENDRVISEFETIEEGLDALKKMNDGEIHSYSHGYEGYYSDHYYLERGKYSLICKGRVELQFKDDAPIESLSKERLSIILSQVSPDEIENVLITLDSERARDLYDSFVAPPVIFNEEKRKITVDFYYLETEEAEEGDFDIFYKCEPFVYQKRDINSDTMCCVERSQN